ncbi:MAG: FAD-dependent thymidylate synthase [Clostridia bacterium]|nr:FAD-dependent thymidylate synthase [Clostridia bacterium]MDE7328882.1 FAD-dependent thymidylate synthase [Clostridia bacterium]
MPQVKPSVTLLEYTPNPERTVALAAKLCYSDATIENLQEGLDKSDITKFIERLRSFGHASPFEHASFTFGIEGVSRSLLAQITRHRIASFSVKSQRYVAANKKDDTFNYVIPEAIEALGEEAIEKFKSQMAQMHEWYTDWQTQLGGACEKSNEDARFVLPNAAETKMVVTMNARSLMNFFHLRCCNRAQWEIREVAWQMLELVLKVAPSIFGNCGASCVSGPCTEGKMSCGKVAEVRAKQKALVEKTTKDAK